MINGNLHGNMLIFMFKFYMKAQKHACVHVFSLFSASFYPPLHHKGKGSITSGRHIRMKKTPPKHI